MVVEGGAVEVVAVDEEAMGLVMTILAVHRARPSKANAGIGWTIMFTRTTFGDVLSAQKRGSNGAESPMESRMGAA